MFVVLTYTIFDLENNIIEKVDSPISHIQGFGKKLLQKIEDKLNGKQAGDELEVRIEPDDGFGNYDDSLIIKDKLSNGYDLGTLASDVRIYAEGISNKMKEARS